MRKTEHFGDVLEEYVSRVGYTPGQLSKLTGVPKPTIESWLKVSVRRPRNGKDILLLASAMRLTEQEADRLLEAAGHKTIHEWREKAEAEGDETLLNQLSLREELVASSPLAPPFLAPLKLNNFVGRVDLIERIQADLLRDGNICILQGMGGIGKSALATQLVYDLRDKFPDGVLWFKVGAEVDEGQQMGILYSIANSYGLDVREESELAIRSRQVRELLARKKALMVLDDVWKVRDIRPLLPGSAKCSILITTRNRALLHEQAISFDISPFNELEGVDLLASYLPETILQEEKVGSQRIIGLLGGLPLALKLVGSDLKTSGLTLLEYHELLLDAHQRLSNLKGWDDEELGVRASFDVSYQRLPTPLQTLFNSLAVFPESAFGIDAVAAVSQLSRTVCARQLGRLHVLSLIETRRWQTLVEGKEITPARHNRYHQHTLLHLYALEKLGTQPGELKELERRAAMFFTAYAVAKKADFPALDLEWENLHHFLKIAQTQNIFEPLHQAVEALTDTQLGIVGYLDAHGYYQEAQAWLSWLLTKFDSEQPSLELASTLWKSGAFAFRLAQNEQARDRLYQAIAILDKLSPTEETALQRAFLAEFLARREMRLDHEAAQDAIEAGLAALEHLDSEIARVQKGNLHIVQGMVLAQMLGAFDLAKAAIQEGLTLLPKEPSPAMLSALLNLSSIGLHTGQLEDAKNYSTQAAEIAKQLGLQQRLATAFMNFGIVNQKQGDLPQAIVHLKEAETIYRRIRDITQLCGILTNLGMVYTIQGKHSFVYACLKEAIELAEEHDEPYDEAIARATLAHVQIRELKLEEATESLKRAQKLCQQYQFGDTLPSVLYWQAEIARLRKDYLEGLKLVEQAIQLTDDGRYLQEEGIAWSAKGKLLDALGHYEKAKAAHQTAIKRLENQDPYEVARAQHSFGLHYYHQRDQLTTKGDVLLQQALKTFIKLVAEYDIKLVRAFLGGV